MLRPLCGAADAPEGPERDAAIRVMSVLSLIQTAAPLMLRSTAQDILHLVFHGTAPQAATALQLAAAAHKRTETTPMTAADRELVRPESPSCCQQLARPSPALLPMHADDAIDHGCCLCQLQA